MVTLTVYVEGGEDHPNMDAAAIGNSAALRKGFHEFFSKLLPTGSQISIEIWPSGGWEQAKNKFLKVEDKNNVVLFVDMDEKFAGLESKDAMREARLQEMGLMELSANTFLMFRETEAWFIFQSAIFTPFANTQNYIRRKADEEIKDNSLLKDYHHPEDIPEPSSKLNTIFRQHFAIQKKSGQKPKPASYHKGKHAPKLLELLDSPRLSPTFSDITRFQAYLSTLV